MCPNIEISYGAIHGAQEAAIAAKSGSDGCRFDNGLTSPGVRGMGLASVLRRVQEGVTIAVVTVGLLMVANWGAEKVLVANPSILLSHDELVAQNFKSQRISLTRGYDEKLWFDLPSDEAVRQMWDETYQGGVQFESYVHFRTHAFMGKYYHANENGYRDTREPGPWPPDPKNYNILFFGGSTAFGVGPYFATIASYLQDEMGAADGRKVYVYNFGRTSYINSQEKIVFERLLASGIRADMAVFFDGLNEFCFRDGKPSNWQLLEHLYNSFHDDYMARARGNDVATRWEFARQFFETLPLVRLARAAATRIASGSMPEYATKPSAAIGEEPSPPIKELEAVMDRYYANVKQISAVGDVSGVQTVFVWQPIPTYKYDTRHDPFVPNQLGCHVGSKFGYPLMRKRVDVLPPSPNFVWLADMQENLKEALYVDTFHYTAPMSRRIAVLIKEAILSRQMPAKAAAGQSRN